MLAYIVLIHVHQSQADAWLEWMQAVHIPDVLRMGAFAQCTLHDYQGANTQAGERSFLIQYTAHSQEALDQYQQDQAPALQADHHQRFGGTFRAERFTLQARFTLS